MRNFYYLAVLGAAAILILCVSTLHADGSVGSAAGTRMASGNLVMDAIVGQVVAGVSGDLVGGHLGQMAAPHYLPGDADGNGSLAISDAVVIINYIFGGGVAPNPLDAADADCSGSVAISDAVFIINYIFGGGAAPEYCRSVVTDR